MLFHSLSFALFLAPVYCVFLLMPGRFKALYLLVVSYLFYGFWSERACVALLLISLVCYWGGHWLRRAEEGSRTQSLRLFALVASMGGLLVYFKFVPLIAQQLHQFASGAEIGNVDFFLLFAPIGFSYFLFQAIGYLVDVCWGGDEARSLKDFLLFMAFFPKVTMGPIERGEGFLPQIEKVALFRFDYDRFREALLLFAWGLFKKLVVAERLALVVNDVYHYPADAPGLPVAVALVCFTFQLYADFSGYTDMALAVGKMFGFELTQNFNFPFSATNIQDFWRRWHISFSTWIGDYIFLPLRMSFRSHGKWGLAAALMITFFVVGIWHGTGWPFVIFGVVQGIYMVDSTLTLPARDAFWEKRHQLGSGWLILSRRLATFGIWTFSLVFFRAGTIPQAFSVLKNLFTRADFHSSLQTLLANHQLLFAAVAVVFMEVGESYIRTPVLFERLVGRTVWLRWPAYILLLLIILRGGVFTSAQRFIYMAF
jgi:alginate O-acetyltransferase complex protein AlgI